MRYMKGSPLNANEDKQARTCAKERPILFSAPMVQAILAGRKTQTRRVMKSQPYTLRTEGFGYPTKQGGFVSLQSEHCRNECPYGKPGDRLWVRENFQPLIADGVNWSDADYETGAGYAISYPATDGVKEFYDCRNDEAFCDRVTPSIHMPRWASRLTLEITEVRVQRLRDCTEGDAQAEGMLFVPDDKIHHTGWRHSSNHGYVYDSALAAYHVCWEEINGEGSWQNNPFVWALTFKVVQL